MRYLKTYEDLSKIKFEREWKLLLQFLPSVKEKDSHGDDKIVYNIEKYKIFIQIETTPWQKRNFEGKEFLVLNIIDGYIHTKNSIERGILLQVEDLQTDHKWYVRPTNNHKLEIIDTIKEEEPDFFEAYKMGLL